MNRVVFILCVVGIIAFVLDLTRYSDNQSNTKITEKDDEFLMPEDYIKVTFANSCMMLNFKEITFYKTNEDFEMKERIDDMYRNEIDGEVSYWLPQEGMYWIQVKTIFGDIIRRIVDVQMDTEVLFEDMIDYLYAKGDVYAVATTIDPITIYIQNWYDCEKSGSLYILTDALDKERLYVEFNDEIDEDNQSTSIQNYTVDRAFLRDLVKIEVGLSQETLRLDESNMREKITIVAEGIGKTYSHGSYRGIPYFKKQIIDLIEVHTTENE